CACGDGGIAESHASRSGPKVRGASPAGETDRAVDFRRERLRGAAEVLFPGRELQAGHVHGPEVQSQAGPWRHGFPQRRQTGEGELVLTANYGQLKFSTFIAI